MSCLESRLAHGAAKATAKKPAGCIVLATVKGDVHDIGKNIVATVLSCSNYRVVDLGVMVPCADIVRAAKEHTADMVGVSGLITPSLEEMVSVARACAQAGCTMPLLVGGATTSALHTAVRICPEYPHGVIHVRDASQCVHIANQLVDTKRRPGFIAECAEKYQRLREEHARAQAGRSALPLDEARARHPAYDWSVHAAPQPSSLGVTVFDSFSLETITRYIDWSPFFLAWELRGRYPDILKDTVVGKEAQKLFADAQELLARIVRKKLLTAKAVVGLYPAAAAGDDIEIYADEGRRRPHAILHTLRQQTVKPERLPHYALSDFIAPKTAPCKDYIGLFIVTTGIGLEKLLTDFDKKHDVYGKIMAKALADRLAEAFAEAMHELVRKELWGYARDENLAPEGLIREEYRGIRPAPGYPAYPDHTEKQIIFDVLSGTQATTVTLTENFAMNPPSSVCGVYIAHPAAQYFGIGKLARDQVADYARRKGMSVEAAETWLKPYLGYSP